METDTYAAFHAALDKAAANPEIKNFVIDLSANGGGESFLVNSPEAAPAPFSIAAQLMAGCIPFPTISI